MKQNILILLESIGSGGVETAVYNKALAFKKKGHNVFIAAKDGIYKEKFKKNGIHFIEFEHEISNNLNLNKLDEMNEIVRKNSITQIHIHQFPCLIYGGLAAINNNIPYMVYLHTEKTDVFEWFINNYAIHKELLNILMKSAIRIVSITRKAVETSMSYFNINEEKYVVERNSINFEDYKTNRQVKEIKNFVIVSRLAREKYDSIKNGIDLFLAYSDSNPKKKTSLKIIGDGEIKNKLEKYVEKKNIHNYIIEFCGQTNNVFKYLDKCDVLIAIGRCILEGIATKRITILSAVDKLKDMITPSSIDNAIDCNFNGRASVNDEGVIIPEMENKSISYLVERLNQLTKKDIDEIVEKNYNSVYKKLNIDTNSFVYEGVFESANYDDLKLYFINFINKYINEIEIIDNTMNELNEELKKRNNELEAIYNSRTWKIRNKLISGWKIKKKK